MRTDLFLKHARLIKRRSVAKMACEQKRVTVNDKVAKPGTEIQVGDRVELQLRGRRLVVQVERLSERVRKEEAASLYTLLLNERIAEEQPSTEAEDDWLPGGADR